MDSLDEYKKSFLGRGWAFPPTFDNRSTSNLTMVEHVDDIVQSLEILLNTMVGERVMLPDYGCDLHAYLFESMNNSKINFVKDIIKTAIVKYESRVDLIDVHINTEDYLDGIMKIGLDYDVISTNTRFNLVFPFYKIEGTDIPQLFHHEITKTLIDDEA